MKFALDMLAKLPIQLLVSSFVLVSTCLPVETAAELLVLTPDNFQSTISQGVWFIEHFSPYCGHCKHFAPTWQILVDEIDALPDPGLQLAQVNCAVHGDLCTANKVTGYPQMNLYKNGHFITTYGKARNLENLHEFLEPYMKEKIIDDESSPNQDEVILSDAVQQRGPEFVPNVDGVVLSLDPSNFQTVMDQGPMFVKFFAPWCGHCKKLAPIWTQLASAMREQLTIAEVNCESYSSLCKSQGVTGYPMLFYYSGGSGPGGRQTEYSGGRKFDQLKKFAEDTVAPAVKKVKDDDFDKLVEENDVLYLFLHSVGDAQQVKQLSQTAHILLGSPPVYSSTSSLLRSRFPLQPGYESVPILIAVKDHIPTSYTSLFRFPTTTDADGDALAHWLLTNRLPTYLELTQDTFQLVMNAPSKPIVVLAAVDPTKNGDEIEKLKALGREWRTKKFEEGASGEGRDVVFSWMDAERWSKWMKSMYGIKVKHLPAVVLVEHQKLLYYPNDRKGQKLTLQADHIFPAIQGVLAGALPYKHSENFIERMIRYLNDAMNYMEEVVTNNPYKTAAFFAVCLIFFIVAVKRFIQADIASLNQYPLKSSRLD